MLNRMECTIRMNGSSKRSVTLVALLLCLGCGDDQGAVPDGGDAAIAGSGGQSGGSGGSVASTGGSGGAGGAGGNGGNAALPDEQKGELWGSWGWDWEGQNECTGQSYTGNTTIGICHANDEVNVTYGGTTYAATWNGTILQFEGRTRRNEKVVDISVSMTIDGTAITDGTGTWIDPDAGCGGTETYTGHLRQNTVWDGELPAFGGLCWLWEP
jgi:hypothetical protein